MKKDVLDYFRLIGFIEGLSYLTLLFIAMPLKYMYGYPEAVKAVGMVHGILFILFVALLGSAARKYNFSMKYIIVLFVASLIPFGTFFTDRRLKEIKKLSLAKV
ncbi:MAG: DUF3817 domain-containing protein [Campylobacterota bacterium]|nr:DUF3817 domain-containing protein [Campylobacterota bacterium]